MTLLTMTAVSCRFGRLAALDQVDLELRAGERRAVIGPNGAGKTTLLGVLDGTTRPSSGRVVLDGRDITSASPARRAGKGIARTFQTPALADSLTALDNVVVGAWRHDRAPLGRRRGWRPRVLRQAQRQLDMLGLARLADVPAGQLAHGQRRLLEIGVALAAQPRLALLDEPAAGLTDTDLPGLLRCLQELPEQVAVLLVEHHMDLVTAFADTVTVLHRGRVLAHGTPSDIHANAAVARAYLGTTGQPAVS